MMSPKGFTVIDRICVVSAGGQIIMAFDLRESDALTLAGQAIADAARIGKAWHPRIERLRICEESGEFEII